MRKLLSIFCKKHPPKTEDVVAPPPEKIWAKTIETESKIFKLDEDAIGHLVDIDEKYTQDGKIKQSYFGYREPIDVVLSYLKQYNKDEVISRFEEFKKTAENAIFLKPDCQNERYISQCEQNLEELNELPDNVVLYCAKEMDVVLKKSKSGGFLRTVGRSYRKQHLPPVEVTDDWFSKKIKNNRCLERDIRLISPRLRNPILKIESVDGETFWLYYKSVPKGGMKIIDKCLGCRTTLLKEANVSRIKLEEHMLLFYPFSFGGDTFPKFEQYLAPINFKKI